MKYFAQVKIPKTVESIQQDIPATLSFCHKIMNIMDKDIKHRVCVYEAKDTTQSHNRTYSQLVDSINVEWDTNERDNFVAQFKF